MTKKPQGMQGARVAFCQWASAFMVWVKVPNPDKHGPAYTEVFWSTQGVFRYYRGGKLINQYPYYFDTRAQAEAFVGSLHNG